MLHPPFTSVSQTLRWGVRRVQICAFLAFCILALELGAGLAQSHEGQHVARVLSVRKVLLDPSPFFTRYPKIHSYVLYFSVRTQDATYCADYETQVVQEVDGLTSAKGKDVEVVAKGKDLIVKMPDGRKFKARLVDQNQC